MQQIDMDFMDFFKKTGHALGLEGLLMDVAAYLYLQPDEVAMEDIAKRTGYSLASVSNSMKSLERLGVVIRIKKPKTKKAFFYMEKDVFKQNVKKFEAFKNYGIKNAFDYIPNIIEKHKKSKDKSVKEKVKILDNYLKQIDDFGKLLDKFVKDLDKLSKKYSGMM